MTCIDKKGFLFYIYKDFKLILGLLLDMPMRFINFIINIKRRILKYNKHCIKRRHGLKPILLIHGYSGYDFQWIPISWFFLKNFDLYTIYIPFDSHSTLVEINIENKINQIYKETGMKVNLIGHSMGGIIASNYIRHPNVEHIITIATPFRGSPLFSYFEFKDNCINDIKHDSHFLNNLHSDIKKEKKTIHCFGGECDFYVPYPRYLPYHSFNDYHLKLTGHLNILIMPSLWKKINNILKSESDN